MPALKPGEVSGYKSKRNAVLFPSTTFQFKRLLLQMVRKLYHGPLGGMSLRALVALTELKIPFEWVLVDALKGETKMEEHLKRHPFGLLPVLVRDPDVYLLLE
jgi:hypothetical protein